MRDCFAQARHSEGQQWCLMLYQTGLCQLNFHWTRYQGEWYLLPWQAAAGDASCHLCFFHLCTFVTNTMVTAVKFIPCKVKRIITLCSVSLWSVILTYKWAYTVSKYQFMWIVAIINQSWLNEQMFGICYLYCKMAIFNWQMLPPLKVTAKSAVKINGLYFVFCKRCSGCNTVK